MATYEKQASGRWKAKIRRKGYPAMSKTFQTKSAAERWAKNIEHSIDNGAFSDPMESQRKTFYEILVRYRDEVAPTHKGSESEIFRLNAFLKLDIAVYKMSGLSPAAFSDYQMHRKAMGVTDGTIRRELDLMSQAIEHARSKWGINLPKNPIEGIKPPPAKARTRRLLDGEEHWILKTLNRTNETKKNGATDMRRNPYTSLYFQFSLETAMRQSEEARLRWENVDLSARTAMLFDTKNSEDRIVPLSDRAIEILENVKDLSFPPDTTPTGLVFNLTTDAIKKSWARCLKTARKAYVEHCEAKGETPNPKLFVDLRWHDLRHEATSRLANDVHILDLGKITGHKDLQMLNRYYQPDPSELAEKIGKTGAARRAKEHALIHGAAVQSSDS